ncbi:Alpha/Beta hydrolase protein [Chiua virens]|nr:Alpha/Beta hydrolase protein [Chiua virens]
MTNVPSATTWGSPSATKHALLLHGLTSSSHTWYRVGASLAAKGYFVTAPNMLGHGLRVSTDYRISSFAEDLRPYLEERKYSLIIGHSLGGLTTLALFAHLPPSHPTAIVLVDPPMHVSKEVIDAAEAVFVDSCINVKPAKVYGAENPLWAPEDSIYRELGTRLCSVDAIQGVFKHNIPWSFLDLLNAASKEWKVTILAADPAIYNVCPFEHIQPYPHVRTVTVTGAGHWIQYEFPEVIVEEAMKTVIELERTGC